MVEPPKTMINLTAFSKDFLVIISNGFKSFSISKPKASPDATQSNGFSLPVAGLEELYGKVIPKASIALAIVFAVYIPPQAPAPGQAFSITS